MIKATLKIGRRHYTFAELFRAVDSRGYIPSPVFWQLWNKQRADCHAAGVTVSKVQSKLSSRAKPYWMVTLSKQP